MSPPIVQAVDIRLSAERGWFGPFHRAVTETNEIRLATLHEIRLLDDGTAVMLYEYRGEEAAARRLAGEYLEQGVADWQTGTIGEAKLMYANSEPSPLVAETLALLEEYRVVVDWPIRFRTDEQLRVTLVGDREEIRGAISAVPEPVRLGVSRAGEYRPRADGLLARSTPREREVLETAVDVGYYRNPREASYEDLASILDRSTGTVGEHLRNAEAKLMAALFEDREPARPRPLESG